MLVGALRRMRERDRALRLVEPRPAVRRIFEITLLDRAFTLQPERGGSDPLLVGATVPRAGLASM